MKLNFDDLGLPNSRELVYSVYENLPKQCLQDSKRFLNYYYSLFEIILKLVRRDITNTILMFSNTCLIIEYSFIDNVKTLLKFSKINVKISDKLLNYLKHDIFDVIQTELKEKGYILEKDSTFYTNKWFIKFNKKDMYILALSRQSSDGLELYRELLTLETDNLVDKNPENFITQIKTKVLYHYCRNWVYKPYCKDYKIGILLKIGLRDFNNFKKQLNN